MQHFAPVLQVTSRAKMAAMVTVHFARNYYVEKIPEVLIYLLIHSFTKNQKGERSVDIILPLFKMLGDSLDLWIS